MHQIGRIAAAGDVRWSFVAALLFVLASVLVRFLYILNSQIPMALVFPEKGKLKHAIVSSHPGETRDIRGYKVSSYALGRMTRSAAFPDHLVIVALLQVGIYAAVLSASTKSSIYHLMDNKTEECFFI